MEVVGGEGVLVLLDRVEERAVPRQRVVLLDGGRVDRQPEQDRRVGRIVLESIPP